MKQIFYIACLFNAAVTILFGGVVLSGWGGLETSRSIILSFGMFLFGGIGLIGSIITLAINLAKEQKAQGEKRKDE